MLSRIQDSGKEEFEYRVLGKDGDYRWLSNRASVIKDANGRPLYRDSSIRNITERKKVDEALLRSEKLASVGSMAASLAHEINNSLGARMNMLYLAQGIKELPELARVYLEMMDNELKRITHVTRQSVGFYREYDVPSKVSVTSVLESAVDLMKSKIRAKRAEIVKDWKHNLEVAAGPGELQQVFSNLIANSLEAMDTRGIIKLRVSTAVTNFRPVRTAFA
jgi:signal transduction histidine kinase